MNYITFWTDLPIEERFKFLAMLDRHYSDRKNEPGRGLEILHRSFMFKLKEIERELWSVETKGKK